LIHYVQKRAIQMFDPLIVSFCSSVCPLPSQFASPSTALTPPTDDSTSIVAKNPSDSGAEPAQPLQGGSTAAVKTQPVKDTSATPAVASAPAVSSSITPIVNKVHVVPVPSTFPVSYTLKGGSSMVIRDLATFNTTHLMLVMLEGILQSVAPSSVTKPVEKSPAAETQKPVETAVQPTSKLGVAAVPVTAARVALEMRAPTVRTAAAEDEEEEKEQQQQQQPSARRSRRTVTINAQNLAMGLEVIHNVQQWAHYVWTSTSFVHKLTVSL
jgi:hypothetical protein